MCSHGCYLLNAVVSLNESGKHCWCVFMYYILMATKSFSSGFIVSDSFYGGFTQHFVKFREVWNIEKVNYKTCWSRSDPWRPHPPTHRTQRIHYETSWYRTPQDPLRGLESMSRQVRGVLAAQGEPPHIGQVVVMLCLIGAWLHYLGLS